MGKMNWYTMVYLGILCIGLVSAANLRGADFSVIKNVNATIFQNTNIFYNTSSNGSATELAYFSGSGLLSGIRNSSYQQFPSNPFDLLHLYAIGGIDLYPISAFGGVRLTSGTGVGDEIGIESTNDNKIAVLSPADQRYIYGDGAISYNYVTHSLEFNENVTALNLCYSNGTNCASTATSSFNVSYNNLLNQNCPSGKIVNGTLANGTFICTTVASSGGGNPFNQNLNTSNRVMFDALKINQTSWVNGTGEVYWDGGSSVLIGVGTSFTTEVRVNEHLLINGSAYTIFAIDSDTQIELVEDGSLIPTTNTPYQYMPFSWEAVNQDNTVTYCDSYTASCYVPKIKSDNPTFTSLTVGFLFATFGTIVYGQELDGDATGKIINFLSGSFTSALTAPNITATSSLKVTGNTNLTGNLVVGGNLSVKRPYWSGYDNSTQTLLNVSSSQIINVSNNNDILSYEMSVVNKQNVTFQQTGVYICTLSPEFFEPAGQSGVITFWMQKNGVDVPWSNSRYTLASNSYSAPAISYTFEVRNVTKDNVRFMWWSDNANTILYSSGALTSPTRPSIPAILLECRKNSEVT